MHLPPILAQRRMLNLRRQQPIPCSVVLRAQDRRPSLTSLPPKLLSLKNLFLAQHLQQTQRNNPSLCSLIRLLSVSTSQQSPRTLQVFLASQLRIRKRAQPSPHCLVASLAQVPNRMRLLQNKRLQCLAVKQINRTHSLVQRHQLWNRSP